MLRPNDTKRKLVGQKQETTTELAKARQKPPKRANKRNLLPSDFAHHVERPPLDPLRIFSRREAAWAVGVAEITLLRETKKGRLSYYKRGRRVFHSGQHLLDWLQQGERKAWKTERW